jgi:hypothetical protein
LIKKSIIKAQQIAELQAWPLFKLNKLQNCRPDPFLLRKLFYVYYP